MADKKASDGAPRRKREAPTIDLTAQEVTAAAADPAPAPDAETMQAAPSEPPVEPPAEASSEQSPPRATDPEIKPAPLPWLALVGAGVGGGAVVAIVLAALWYGDVVPARTAAPADNSAPLAALQKQIQDLQSRPAAPVVDTKAVDALTRRVAAMEESLKGAPKTDGTISDRMLAAENALKSLGLTLTALSKRGDDAAANAAEARKQAEAAQQAIAQLRGSVQDAAKQTPAATPAEIDALTQRLATLEQASQSVRDALNKTTASDKAARLALSAAALRAKVESGAPYAAELAQAKALGAPDSALAPLNALAASGVPSAAALAQELRGVLLQMVKTTNATLSGSFFERLQANASKLVKVTPVDAPPGNDTADVLARLEVEAARADINGALADLAGLPEQTRAPARDWIAKAKAREAALAAARDLAAETARSLAPR